MKDKDSKASVSLTRLTILDLILIIFIIAFSTGFILHTQLGDIWRASEATEAAIHHEGALTDRLALGKAQDFELLGGRMILEVKENRVRVKKSDCPRQLCVRSGWIDHPGEAIVCLPYKTLIEIESDGPPVVDAVVY